MAGTTFTHVQNLRPGRSVFDLSYEKKFNCDMGQLIPVMCDEVIPGDSFTIGNEVIVRMQPLVAPVMHEINAYIHYFFVPYRILWDDWEDFITGGILGDFAGKLPRWEPTDNTIGSLWDYLGFPTGVDPVGAYPIDFPRRAYARIWNEYYRDETLMDEVDENQEIILNRAWGKDYFASALPFQQRGTAPALPISGTSFAEWSAAVTGTFANTTVVSSNSAQTLKSVTSSAAPAWTATATSTGNVIVPGGSTSTPEANLNNNVVDLSSATTFNVADLRLAFQVQKWLERNARAGARYTEFLKAHYGESPRDERLQRPEYLGGSKSPVIISEVLQTSSTDVTSPQGNLAGHGMAIDRTFAAKYHAQEFGLIMGLMSIMPTAAYQQGIDRQWLRRTKYDFPFPEFANLSEQAIEMAEIYAQGTEVLNTDIFGYQGRYDELRVKRNMVCAGLRDTFDYWHLGRKFTEAPLLNEEFLTCIPSKRIFAVQDEPGLIVTVGNRIKAVRPLPIQAEPGLIDHN